MSFGYFLAKPVWAFTAIWITFLTSELSGFFQKSETPRGYLVHTERAAEAPTMRGATETSALLEAPSYARGPPERAGPSSAGKFRDVEEGVAPDVDGHDQHRRGRGLFARVVAGGGRRRGLLNVLAIRERRRAGAGIAVVSSPSSSPTGRVHEG